MSSLKGVGDKTAQLLKRLHIETVQDLIEHVPFRFEDYSQVTPIAHIKPGPVTIKARLTRIKARYSKRGLHMTEALAVDDSSSVHITWFNQPYRAKALKPDSEYFISGEFASNFRHLSITNPACELVSSFPVNTARLVPVYRLTSGLGVASVRKATKTALQSYTFPETLPAWLVEQEQLVSKAEAYQWMHFPEDAKTLSQAKRRLAFEEVFELTLASELNKADHKREHAMQIPYDEKILQRFTGSLPFQLTDDQRRAAWEAIQDLAAGSPMNRLVEGDVGSGKTAVAALVSLVAMESGYQVAFMAPTELLAKQHAESLRELLSYVNRADDVLLLTGSLSKQQKERAYRSIKTGQAKCIVGTHALIQKDVNFHKLGLVIVDEQHRFGVDQRKLLQTKAPAMPHVLHLTATPIPRSLALTLYGELDFSVIKQLPPGRKTIKTSISIRENRNAVYEKVAAELKAGRQAYAVCPQIEESDTATSVKKVYDELQKNQLKDFRLALLHGKLKTEAKHAAMQAFVNGEVDVLVATTVIEVGVDVPNATVMVVEGADGFGLAQLHQLRGRVGRGSDKSYCYLMLSSNDQPSRRLLMLERESNGFKLAEYDLELRGPGAIYGTTQHGALDLRVAKLTDVELIKSARNAAQTFVKKGEKLVKYPLLEARINQLRTVTNLN